MQLTWASLWSFRTGLENPLPLDLQLGFRLDGQVRISATLVRQVESMAVRELQEFLAGAPVEIAKVFIHRLPARSLDTVLRSFEPQYHAGLKLAHQNPVSLGRQ